MSPPSNPPHTRRSLRIQPALREEKDRARAGVGEKPDHGADLDERDVVVLGVGERLGALSLAAGELIAGRVQKASPPLDERDKQSLPVAIERAGECAGPRRGHLRHDVSRGGQSASGSIARPTPRDDRVSCLHDHRVLVSDECS
jgi:hypothetical protein